jgi:hypothetical protein
MKVYERCTKVTSRTTGVSLPHHGRPGVAVSEAAIVINEGKARTPGARILPNRASSSRVQIAMAEGSIRCRWIVAR